MRILFDFVHPADVNLFKNSILQLRNQGHEIILTLRERGILSKIAQKEFPNFEIFNIGAHQKGVIKKVLSILKRELKFFNFLRLKNVDVAVCQGVSFGIACKLNRIPLIHHDDDPEYRITYLMGKYLSTVDIVPDSINVDASNFVKYKGFKEVAYLHPKYFIANETSISNYGLLKFNYVFIREISNISSNYQGRKSFLLEVLKHLKSLSLIPILSIEDKSQIDYFKDFALILREPLDDLYSLIFYSKFVISSGDTMAREASILGVPCIYTGGRKMEANDVFLQLGFMFKMDSFEQIKLKMDELRQHETDMELREQMQKYSEDNFQDLNEIISNQILKFNK